MGVGSEEHTELSQNGWVDPSLCFLIFLYFHNQDWTI